MICHTEEPEMIAWINFVMFLLLLAFELIKSRNKITYLPITELLIFIFESVIHGGIIQG